jgi:DNA-binding winged helix-turn-helix (wHTH) protein
MIAVEPKVYDLILYLVRNRDRVVTKAELFGNVWPGAMVGESALTRCVSIARRVIGEDVCIKSLYKRGYRFVGKVVEDAWTRSDESVAWLSEPRLSSPQFIGKR